MIHIGKNLNIRYNINSKKLSLYGGLTMTILKDNEKFNLTENTITKLGISIYLIPKEKGVIEKIFGSKNSKESVESDCAAFVLQDGKLTSPANIVYFGNLTGPAPNYPIRSQGSYDEYEYFEVDLTKFNPEHNSVIFALVIYNSQKNNNHLGMYNELTVTVKDTSTNNEIIKYPLLGDYNDKTSLVLCELAKENDTWFFKSVSKAQNDINLDEISKHYK